MAIEMADLMPRQAWSRYRREHQRQLLASLRARTVSLGPHLRLQFENEQSLRYRIQEVLRVERIDDALAVQCEIDAWAHLLPDGTQWLATLVIEWPNAALREQWMPVIDQAIPLLYVEVPRQPQIVVQALEDPPDRHLRRAAGGLHFLRFALNESFRRAVLGGQSVHLGCEHDRYRFRRLISAAMHESLRGDLDRPRGTRPDVDRPGCPVESLSP